MSCFPKGMLLWKSLVIRGTVDTADSVRQTLIPVCNSLASPLLFSPHFHIEAPSYI